MGNHWEYITGGDGAADDAIEVEEVIGELEKLLANAGVEEGNVLLDKAALFCGLPLSVDRTYTGESEGICDNSSGVMNITFLSVTD